MNFKRLFKYSTMMLLILGYLVVSCSDSDNDYGKYDPSKPAEFTEFTPLEGSMRTRLFLKGKNFGSDISKIKVIIGGVSAKVVGADENQIFCMVPPRINGEEVIIQIYGDDNSIVFEHKFEETFKYLKSSSVGTLVGKVDPSKPTGSNSSIVNGPFEEAEFESPYWLHFNRTDDGDEYLYVLEQGKAMRQVDLTNKTVSTLFTNGQGMFTKSFTFTPDLKFDTLFIADDHGNYDMDKLAAVRYTLKSEGFKTVYPYIMDKTALSISVDPVFGDVFYNTYWNGTIVKARGHYNETNKKWEPKDMVQVWPNTNSHLYFYIHPDGLYTYTTGNNCMMKVDMMTDKDGRRIMGQARNFVGVLGGYGYADGVGQSARLDMPRQGVFVKNDIYVKEGKTDVYDFYIADEANHAIRKITPAGVVSTYAGRGPGQDNKVEGYVDGDLRSEARFYRPTGIAYDEKTKTFYIADNLNKRIRTITIQ